MQEKLKKALETYDKYAKTYADYTFPKLLQFQLNKFISMIPKNSKVLDVGCGCGRDCKYFKEFELNIIGIDISKGLLGEAKKRVQNVEFKEMDMKNLKFKDEEFEGIWCMASLADVPKEECLKTLKEWNRVLKKQGVAYIAVKEGEGEAFEEKEKYNGAIRYYSYHTKKELRRLLEKSGFEIIELINSEDNGTKWIEAFAKKN